VAAARKRHEPRARDAAGQPPAIVERQDPILLTVDDERGRSDLGQAHREVVSPGSGVLAAVVPRIKRSS
jgi:hypothetical protein